MPSRAAALVEGSVKPASTDLSAAVGESAVFGREFDRERVEEVDVERDIDVEAKVEADGEREEDEGAVRGLRTVPVDD